MPNKKEIKAIFSLLQTEAGHKEQLTKSLAEFYRKEPKQVYALAVEYFGVLPPDLTALFKANQSGFAKEIDTYLKLKNPSLLEGLILIAKIINPQAKREEILELFNFAREDFDSYLDSTFEIGQKAQVLKTFFFGKMGFKVANLSRQTELLNLPEIFKNLTTTPLVLAVVYLIFISPYEVKGDIFEAENKIIVRLRDSFSLEPVYIDIINRGQFVDEDECHMYAAGNFIKWDSNNIIPLTNIAIFKHLLANLIYISGEYGFLSCYLI